MFLCVPSRNSERSRANCTHHYHGAAASIWADRAREKDQALHPRPRLNLFCFSRRATVTGACPRAFLLEFFIDDPRSVFLQTHIFESPHVSIKS